MNETKDYTLEEVNRETSFIKTLGETRFLRWFFQTLLLLGLLANGGVVYTERQKWSIGDPDAELLKYGIIFLLFLIPNLLIYGMYLNKKLRKAIYGGLLRFETKYPNIYSTLSIIPLAVWVVMSILNYRERLFGDLNELDPSKMFMGFVSILLLWSLLILSLNSRLLSYKGFVLAKKVKKEA